MGAEDKRDPAQGPVHSTPKGEGAAAGQACPPQHRCPHHAQRTGKEGQDPTKLSPPAGGRPAEAPGVGVQSGPCLPEPAGLGVEGRVLLGRTPPPRRDHQSFSEAGPPGWLTCSCAPGDPAANHVPPGWPDGSLGGSDSEEPGEKPPLKVETKVCVELHLDQHTDHCLERLPDGESGGLPRPAGAPCTQPPEQRKGASGWPGPCCLEPLVLGEGPEGGTGCARQRRLGGEELCWGWVGPIGWGWAVSDGGGGCWGGRWDESQSQVLGTGLASGRQRCLSGPTIWD